MPHILKALISHWNNKFWYWWNISKKFNVRIYVIGWEINTLTVVLFVFLSLYLVVILPAVWPSSEQTDQDLLLVGREVNRALGCYTSNNQNILTLLKKISIGIYGNASAETKSWLTIVTIHNQNEMDIFLHSDIVSSLTPLPSLNIANLCDKSVLHCVGGYFCYNSAPNKGSNLQSVVILHRSAISKLVFMMRSI